MSDIRGNRSSAIVSKRPGSEMKWKKINLNRFPMDRYGQNLP
ncbi:hypothetical protein [Mucilaginibacter gynuensis]